MLLLRSLGLTSTKGFNERQVLDLQDLNLIYGANSSGKSSIFQSILLLQQSGQRAFGADRGVLEFRGSSVDLGGFRTFVHRHEIDRTFTLDLGVELPALDQRLWEFHRGEATVALTFGLVQGASEPQIVGMRVTAPDFNVGFKWDEELHGLFIADAASAAVLVDRWAERYMTTMERRPKEMPGLTDADRRWLRNWVRTHACEVQGWVPSWSLDEVGQGKQGRPHGGSLKSPKQMLLTWFLYGWHSWASEVGWQLFSALESVVYVGPLREFPRRVVTEANSGGGLGARGEGLVLHLARRPDLVAKVNRAFTALEIDYQLTVEQVKAEGTEDALGDVAIAVLKDVNTGVSVSPADVGFGLSQVLPVVVQLVGSTNSLVMIEQPEIHLHPKIQSRLADILIESVVENGNQLLIETHSEHLLMRIQRRLREASVEGFDASRVGVNFVSSVDGTSRIEPLRMDDEGHLIDPWPGGFFDERLDDLFAGL